MSPVGLIEFGFHTFLRRFSRPVRTHQLVEKYKLRLYMYLATYTHLRINKLLNIYISMFAYKCSLKQIMYDLKIYRALSIHIEERQIYDKNLYRAY